MGGKGVKTKAEPSGILGAIAPGGSERSDVEVGPPLRVKVQVSINRVNAGKPVTTVSAAAQRGYGRCSAIASPMRTVIPGTSRSARSMAPELLSRMTVDPMLKRPISAPRGKQRLPS